MKPHAFIQQLLQTTIGLDPVTVGDTRIEIAVRRRMEARGVDQVAEYARQLARDDDELQELVEAVVVPETFFFREHAGLAAVADMFRTGALPATAQHPLRVLSLPCASGEEPYSIAMTLFAAGCAGDALRIDAIDVSRAAVCRAREARYSPSAFRGNVNGYREYFIEAEGEMTVRPDVRGCVHVAAGNLFADGFAPASLSYHVIFCRNLLIYFDAAARERALGVIARYLRPGGVLLVDPASAFAVRQAGFLPVGTEAASAFRRAPANGTDSNGRVSGSWMAMPSGPQHVVRSRTPIGIPARQRLTPIAPPRQTPLSMPTGAIRNAVPDASPPPMPSIGDIAALADAGRLEEAARLGKSVAGDRGATADLFVLLGTVDAALGDAKQAQAWFRRALYLEPTRADALLHLSLLLDREGETEAAERVRARAKRVAAGGSR